MIRIVGIDPGWSGGVATLDETGKIESVLTFNGMTEQDIIRAMLIACVDATACYIEKVHSMPKQGVASSFKFGWNYGMLRTMVISMQKPMYEVTPQKWQKRLSCMTKGDKNVTKARAQEFFPHIKVTHGNADALLIAEYGRLVYAEEHPTRFE